MLILTIILTTQYILAPPKNYPNNYIEYIKSINIIRNEQIQDSLEVNYLKSLKIHSKNFFSKEERKKTREIANYLGIKKVSWLYQIFYIESRLNPKVVNTLSGATGLIQWLPKTAIICGTTTDKLRKMTVIEQLDYVKVYFKLALNGKKVNSFLDLYLAVFSPNAIGKSDSFIIGAKNSRVTKLNSSLMNKDSIITKKDIRLRLVTYILM